MADGTVIDKLQIEIEASAKDINTVLTTMANNLARLQKALNGLDNSKFLKTIKALQDAMKNVNGQSISPKVNTSSVDKTQAQIEKAMQKIQDSIIKANSLAQAAFNGDSSSATSYERKAISIQGEIDVLRNKLQQLSNVEIQTEEFIKLDNQIEETRVKFDEVIAKEEEFRTKGGDINTPEYEQLVADITRYRDELDRLIDAQQQMVENGTAFYNPFREYSAQLNGLQDTLSNTRNQVSALNTTQVKPTVDFSALTKLNDVLKNTLSTVKTLTSKLISLGKTVTTKAFNGIKSGIGKIQNSFSDIGTRAGKLHSILNSGFMKILRYGFGIRSLYVLFRRLKQAIKDSFTELQKSGAEWQTTKANIESLKNSLSTLKYQFGAAFEPIFNTIAPALQTLINYLVAAMNTISAFIAKITGRSTYSKVKQVTAAVADNTGAAASNAKELNKQLQGFDELNNISPENNGGSGGGGGGASDGDSVTYEEANVESALGNLANTLAEQIKAGDWKGVGTTISTAITDSLNSIDWNSIKNKASAFGKNLADFVCGLVTPNLFSALGTTLAEAIKTALTASNSFAVEMNNSNGWSNLGISVASGISAFVQKNPLALATETFNNWASGILTALTTSVKTLIDNGTITQIKDHIIDALNNLKAGEIAENLGSLANTLGQALYILVSDPNTWSKLGEKIKEGISGFLKGMGTENSTTGKTGWEAYKDSFVSSLSGLKTMLEEVVDISTSGLFNNSKYGDSIFSTILDTVKSIWNTIKSIVQTTVEWSKSLNLTPLLSEVDGFLGTIGDSVNTILGILRTIYNNTILPLTKKVTESYLPTLLSIVKETLGAISSILGNLPWDTVTKFLTMIVELVSEVGLRQLTADMREVNSALWSLSTIVESVTSIFSSFKEIIKAVFGIKFKSESWESFKKVMSIIMTNGNPFTASLRLVSAGLSLVATAFETAANAVDEAKETLIEIGSNIWEGIKKGFSIAWDWTKPVRDLFNGIIDTIKDIFGIDSPAKSMYEYGKYIGAGIIEGFKNFISGNAITEAVSEFFDKVKEALDIDGDGKISFSEITIGIKSKFTGVFKKLDELTGFSSKLKTIKEKYSELKSDFKTTLSGKISEITDFDTLTEKVENFKNAFVDKVVTFTTWLGGQVQNITVFDSWRSKVSEFKNVFTDSSATFKAYVGGQVDNIEGIVSDSGWRGKISNFKKSWENSSASTSFNVTSNINDVDKSGGWKDRLINAANTWKNTNPTSTFKTSLTGSLTTADDISTVAESFKTLKENYPSGNHESSWSTTLGGASVEDMNSFADAAQNIYNKFYTGDHSATWTMTLSNSTAGVDAFINNFVDKLNQKLKTVKVNMSLSGAANGGVILASGKKLDIPQYAGGTLNAGSMFIAGEHGPEILGHINGRTEVLNRSQIASTMNHAIVQGMSQFRNMSLASPESLKYSSYSYDGYDNGGNESQLLTEQNSLIREQNDLLRQLLAKDPKVGVDDVFSAVRSGASDYYNRTGNSPFVF